MDRAPQTLRTGPDIEGGPASSSLQHGCPSPRRRASSYHSSSTLARAPLRGSSLSFRTALAACSSSARRAPVSGDRTTVGSTPCSSAGAPTTRSLGASSSRREACASRLRSSSPYGHSRNWTPAVARAITRAGRGRSPRRGQEWSGERSATQTRYRRSAHGGQGCPRAAAAQRRTTPRTPSPRLLRRFRLPSLVSGSLGRLQSPDTAPQSTGLAEIGRRPYVLSRTGHTRPLRSSIFEAPTMRPLVLNAAPSDLSRG